MSNEFDLAKEILIVLKKEVPEKYKLEVEEFQKLVEKRLYRASYAILNNLCKKKDWHPSSKVLGLREKYQVVF